MYQDDEDDWQILKEYKQQKRNKLTQKVDDYRRQENRCKREIPVIEQEIAQLEEVVAREQARPAHRISAGYPTGGGMIELPNEQLAKAQGELQNKQLYLADLRDDLSKAVNGQKAFTSEKQKLARDIQRIDAKIKDIRRRRQEQKKAPAAKELQEPIQECAKKCRVENVTMQCGHGSRGLTFDVAPMNPDHYEVPELHVISGSESSSWDKVTIRFGGSCDFGKSSSAPDATKAKLNQRYDGATDYCPRISIGNSNTNTRINRPNGVVVAAKVPAPKDHLSSLRFLYENLFKLNYQDGQTYYGEFLSCQGSLPYRAKIIAYPNCKVSAEATFGYEAETSINNLKVDTGQKVKSYDGIKASGGWQAAMKYAYEYDIRKGERNVKLSLPDFIEESGNQSNFLSALQTFFDPLSGFFENALANEDNVLSKSKYAKAARKNAQHDSSEAKKQSLSFKGPNVKFSYSLERAEQPGSPLVGQTGKFNLEFAPLLGITGKIELMPYLLASLGGPFGVFLEKVCNYSAGETDGTHITTDLSLTISATASVSGKLSFESTLEKGWQVAGDSGITGLIGFELAGKVGTKGKIWVVKFACGAEFKTTDESGNKPSGIEVYFKPLYVTGRFSAVGNVAFNGLSIVYALYASAGREGTEGNAKKGKSRGRFSQNAKLESDMVMKDERKVALFAKRELFSVEDKVQLDV